MPIVQNIEQYFATVKTGFRSKSMILLTLVYTITSFALSMSFFQVIFLKQSLGFSEVGEHEKADIFSAVQTFAFVISILLLQKDKNHNHTAYPHC